MNHLRIYILPLIPIPDDLVPPPRPAPRLAGCGDGGDLGLCVVAVVAGQLYLEGIPGPDPGLLGRLPRPDDAVGGRRRAGGSSASTAGRDRRARMRTCVRMRGDAPYVELHCHF